MVSLVTLAPGAAVVMTAGELLLLLLQVVSRVTLARRARRRPASRQRRCCRSYRSLTLPRVQLEVEPTVAGGKGKLQLFFPVGAKEVA